MWSDKEHEKENRTDANNNGTWERRGVTEKESQDTKLIIDNIADDVLCFVMHLLSGIMSGGFNQGLRLSPDASESKERLPWSEARSDGAKHYFR